jgi:hypothetical protein
LAIVFLFYLMAFTLIKEIGCAEWPMPGEDVGGSELSELSISSRACGSSDGLIVCRCDGNYLYCSDPKVKLFAMLLGNLLETDYSLYNVFDKEFEQIISLQEYEGIFPSIINLKVSCEKRDFFGVYLTEETLLSVAAWQGRLSPLDRLIRCGADVGLQNSHGVTAFTTALCGYCIRIKKELCSETCAAILDRLVGVRNVFNRILVNCEVFHDHPRRILLDGRMVRLDGKVSNVFAVHVLSWLCENWQDTSEAGCVVSEFLALELARVIECYRMIEDKSRQITDPTSFGQSRGRGRRRGGNGSRGGRASGLQKLVSTESRRSRARGGRSGL